MGIMFADGFPSRFERKYEKVSHMWKVVHRREYKFLLGRRGIADAVRIVVEQFALHRRFAAHRCLRSVAADQSIDLATVCELAAPVADARGHAAGRTIGNDGKPGTA